ncbi:unnamed protein product, partial [Phaeothamnion confervicola]
MEDGERTAGQAAPAARAPVERNGKVVKILRGFPVRMTSSQPPAWDLPVLNSTANADSDSPPLLEIDRPEDRGRGVPWTVGQVGLRRTIIAFPGKRRPLSYQRGGSPARREGFGIAVAQAGQRLLETAPNGNVYVAARPIAGLPAGQHVATAVAAKPRRDTSSNALWQRRSAMAFRRPGVLAGSGAPRASRQLSMDGRGGMSADELIGLDDSGTSAPEVLPRTGAEYSAAASTAPPPLAAVATTIAVTVPLPAPASGRAALLRRGVDAGRTLRSSSAPRPATVAAPASGRIGHRAAASIAAAGMPAQRPPPSPSPPPLQPSRAWQGVPHACAPHIPAELMPERDRQR